MLIYVGKNFTATVTGSRIRTVHCERCSQEYHYELARVGSGHGTAPYYIGQSAAAKRAERAAQKHLERQLSRSEEAVPCPSCGWIQEAMVLSIRRQRYRWILQLVWVGVPAALVILGFAALFTYLDRYAKPSQLISIGKIAGWTVASGAALLSLRSLLLSRIDPNALYPQRPAVSPGTPPALIKQVEGGVERFIPATMEPVIQTDDWAEVQFQRCALPLVCCECLGTAERNFQTPIADPTLLPVPVCHACQRRLTWRWWRWTGVSVVAALLIAGGIAAAIPKADTFARWFVFVVAALFGSILGIAVLSNSKARPYRMKKVDLSRGVIRLKFRNAQYTRLLAEEYLLRGQAIATAAASAEQP